MRTGKGSDRTEGELSVSGKGDPAGEQRDLAGEQRDVAGEQRDHAGQVRDDAGEQRDHAGVRRDLAADQRDEAADERDLAADRRDEAAERSETSGPGGIASDTSLRTVLARREAASDRRRASQDRQAGATERNEAELDRGTALADRGSGATERSAAELDRGTALADRGASARSGERMLALHRASAVLAGQTDPTVVLDEILKNAVGVLGRGSASLFIWVPEAKVLRNVRDLQVRDGGTSKMLRTGQGIAGMAFERLTPVVVNDYQGWEGASPAAREAGQQAALGVPLVRQGEPIGALVARSYDPARGFTDEDGHLLMLFADLAVAALTAAEAFEQQRAAVSELERLSRAKSDFVSIVSHEFRTPLTGIRGFSEMIRDDELTPEEVREYAANINTDAQRLSRMITDMLDLDRMESGRMELAREPVDVNAIVMDEAGRVRANAPAHPLTLDLAADLPPVLGDIDKITQVVTNLLSNAVKYSPDGGPVTVATRAEAGRIHVSVRDRGLGIPKEAHESVFERYSRIESGATKHIQGTGLGLPIVRQIVEMHGGRVWVESTLGEGSDFQFTLPAGPA